MVDQRVAQITRHSNFGEWMLRWPAEQRHDGQVVRDLMRVSTLVLALEMDEYGTAAIFAPTKWIDGEHTEINKTYQDNVQAALRAQVRAMGYLNQGTKVPVFDVKRAAGSAGHWNHAQPYVRRKTKNQTYTPPITLCRAEVGGPDRVLDGEDEFQR